MFFFAIQTFRYQQIEPIQPFSVEAGNEKSESVAHSIQWQTVKEKFLKNIKILKTIERKYDDQIHDTDYWGIGDQWSVIRDDKSFRNIYYEVFVVHKQKIIDKRTELAQNPEN